MTRKFIAILYFIVTIGVPTCILLAVPNGTNCKCKRLHIFSIRSCLNLNKIATVRVHQVYFFNFVCSLVCLYVWVGVFSLLVFFASLLVNLPAWSICLYFLLAFLVASLIPRQLVNFLCVKCIIYLTQGSCPVFKYSNTRLPGEIWINRSSLLQ